jgi:hypothetical protein
MTSERDDRTVHASSSEWEIVRYDRAGKWFVEWKAGLIPCRQVGVREAARLAVKAAKDGDGEIFLGRAGGRSFDRLVNYAAV